MKKQLAFCLAVLASQTVFAQIPHSLQQPDAQLWYEQPASRWYEALPVGNGRLGAMVFGGTDEEIIQVNEESIWAGQPINNNNPQALEHLPELRRMLLAEQTEEAAKLVAKYFIGTPPRVRSYQTAGEIRIVANGKRHVANYRRTLLLEPGVVQTAYVSGETKYAQTVFASAPDNVLVVHMRAEGPGTIDVRVSMVRTKDASVSAQDDQTLVLKGQIIDPPDARKGPGGAHMRFAAILEARNNGGTVSAHESSLIIRKARDVTLVYTAITDYDPDTLGFNRSIDPVRECKTILQAVAGKPYRNLLSDHIKDHAAMFNRVALRLPKTATSSRPTDQRLEAVKKGKSDPSLTALYFQFGRYLLMGSSRHPGKLPANLQGIWNDKYQAPWSSDFHTNINLQMNYWPAEVANLPECVEPLSHFMQKLTVPGARTAREMYGARGWTFHHLTDPFGRTGVMDGAHGVTPMDGPWMTFPLWRHYVYTRDTDYLEHVAYPLMKGAAQFVLDFLIEDANGRLVTAPSSSPENAYYLPGTKKKAKLTYAATMDIEIITALFRNCIEAAELLDTDLAFRKQLAVTLERLPPLQIGQDGTLQEWIKDYQEVSPGHRHISHLLGLYPLDQINPETPALFTAARKTIERRLSHGGGHTGWSRAWVINFYDRLLMPEEAHKHLRLLLVKSTLPNLFDTHPPFQIDGNFGGTAAIAGMLLQSHGNTIRLLPALPSAWDHGAVKGLKTRGNFTIAMQWQEHRLKRVTILAGSNESCSITYGNAHQRFDAQQGTTYTFDASLNPLN